MLRQCVSKSDILGVLAFIFCTQGVNYTDHTSVSFDLVEQIFYEFLCRLKILRL